MAERFRLITQLERIEKCILAIGVIRGLVRILSIGLILMSRLAAVVKISGTMLRKNILDS